MLEDYERLLEDYWKIILKKILNKLMEDYWKIIIARLWTTIMKQDSLEE